MDLQAAAGYTRSQLDELQLSYSYPEIWIGKWLPPEWADPRLQRLYAIAPDSDERLARAVQLIQEWVYGNLGDAALGVEQQPATFREMDGKMGPSTYHRMITWEELVASDGEIPEVTLPGESYLLYRDEKIPVPNTCIIHGSDEGGLSFERAYKERKSKAAGEKVKRGYGRWKKGKTPNLLATVHWDAALSAKSGFNILKKRGYSSAIGIDNPHPDGTVPVYQWLDWGNHYGYHAGTEINRRSLLSFDLTNAVNLKYAKRYKKVAGIPRPVIDASPHGEQKKLLGMYKGQILTLLRILKAANRRFPHLDFAFPIVGGMPVEEVYSPLFSETYTGAHTHLHITTRKWDVSGLEAQIIYLMIKDPAIANEFPELADLYAIEDHHWGEWIAEKEKSWIWDGV